MINRRMFLTIFVAGLLSIDASAVTISIPGIGDVKIKLPGESSSVTPAQPTPTSQPSAQKPNESASGARATKKRSKDQEGDDDISSSGQRPVEISNEIPGGAISARSRSVPGLDPVKTAGVKYDDAIRCAALIDLANIIDKRIDGFIYPSASIRYPIWDKMIDLHPKMSKMPFAEADNMCSSLVMRYTGDNIDLYRKNHDLLSKDYQRCKVIGLFPSR